jgi:hypothetical protein
MQKHHIDVTKRVELTSAISAKGDQREWNRGRAVPASSSRCRSTENVLQQDINQLRPSRTNFAATPAGLVFQAQPILLNLEKLLVKREDFGRTLGTRGRKARCGVRQNLFQMTGRSHRQFRLLFNLKSDLQNPNPSQMAKERSVNDALPSC